MDLAINGSNGSDHVLSDPDVALFILVPFSDISRTSSIQPPCTEKLNFSF